MPNADANPRHNMLGRGAKWGEKAVCFAQTHTAPNHAGVVRFVRYVWRTASGMLKGFPARVPFPLHREHRMDDVVATRFD